ncbi:MAG: DUF2461 domain-containing protein [Oscillospiraceae bacterium]|nr:DUF2461 domain-containing protein [Oscillospiraceae bacterium]
MAFSAKSLDFLFENRLHDSKQWYQDHKEDYRQYVSEPFAVFIEKIEPVIKEIDDKIICNPKKISRLYRDTRFSKGGSIFRDNVWCIFGRPREPYQDIPAFYFEINPDGFTYGCGCYRTSTDAMNAYRKMILDNDKIFCNAKKAYESQNIFTLEGEFYKRNKFIGESEDRVFWLNRKNIYLQNTSNDMDILFSDNLASKIGEEFRKIAPVYDLMIKAEDIAAQQKIHI